MPLHDPVFRQMRSLTLRSDVVDVRRCVFSEADCARAAVYLGAPLDPVLELLMRDHRARCEKLKAARDARYKQRVEKRKRKGVVDPAAPSDATVTGTSAAAAPAVGKTPEEDDAEQQRQEEEEDANAVPSYWRQHFWGVRTLRLQVGCGMRGVQHLLPAIALHSHTVERLDLARCRLNADDVAPLMRAVLGGPKGCALQVLDLSYNHGLGSAGGAATLNALRGHTSLLALLLRQCNIDDVGAITMAPFVRERPVPTRIARSEGSDDDAAPRDGPSSSTRVTVGVPRGVIDEDGEAVGPWLRPIEAGGAGSKQRAVCSFNLSENFIAGAGVRALAYRMPDHVGMCLLHQRCAAAVLRTKK
jgi:hypothetical protein